MKIIQLGVKCTVMQEDSANDLKVLQEWFETNRVRETGIVENVQKQPASTERDEMLEICKGNIEEFSMMIQLVASIIEREKEQGRHPKLLLFFVFATIDSPPRFTVPGVFLVSHVCKTLEAVTV